MKLQTESIKNGRNNDKWLIRYFDMSWVSIEKLLDTTEGINSGLNIQVIRYRLKKNKIKTLEDLLKPKQKYSLRFWRASPSYYPKDMHNQ